MATSLSGTGRSLATPALLDISAPSVAFSDTSVGTTSNTATFTVTNTGETAAIITSRFFGTTQFNVTGGTCASNSTVAVSGGTCTVVGTFNPTSAWKTDNLTVVYNDGKRVLRARHVQFREPGDCGCIGYCCCHVFEHDSRCNVWCGNIQCDEHRRVRQRSPLVHSVRTNST